MVPFQVRPRAPKVGLACIHCQGRRVDARAGLGLSNFKTDLGGLLNNYPNEAIDLSNGVPLRIAVAASPPALETHRRTATRRGAASHSLREICDPRCRV